MQVLRHRLHVALAFLSLLSPACNKDKKAETLPREVLERSGKGGPSAQEQAETAEALKAVSPLTEKPAPEPPVADAPGDGPAYPEEVRPPEAADLSHYVADLGTSGPLVAVLTTSKGTIQCELADKAAPLAVANFVGLARGMKPFIDPRDNAKHIRRFYDGLIFHRVIPDFMIQGGDPTGTGSGGPGYTFKNEISDWKHDKGGVLAMANAGPDTNGSQFYITEKEQSFLDGSYTVFGRCKKESVDVVKKIARVETTVPNRPVDPVILQRVEIRRGFPTP
jgi:peptidyl-prolyl cis-trans isomerase A (cyclophilin A)